MAIDQDGAQHAVDTDAARLQRDRLAIRREASERDEQANQQRNRNRDREGLGHQRHEHAGDQLPGDALGDEPLALFRQRLDEEQEGEDQQPDQEGQQEFADNIPVEDPQHLGCAG